MVLIATPPSTTHVALPVELWYSILARVLGDEIHVFFKSSDAQFRDPQIEMAAILPSYGFQFTTLLLVSKLFQSLVGKLLCIACAIPDCNSYAGIARKAMQSLLQTIQRRISVLETDFNSHLPPTFHDGVKSPLLEAHGHFIASLHFQYWENGNNEVLRPGNHVFDAFRLCRHHVLPKELCESLIVDVIHSLEDTQLDHIIESACQEIFELCLRHCRITNMPAVDPKLLREFQQHLHSQLFRIEHSEAEAVKSLQHIDVPHPQTRITTRLVQRVRIVMDHCLYLFNDDYILQQWIQRVADQWRDVWDALEIDMKTVKNVKT